MVEQRAVAAVVIGRNEGQRLPASILSAQAAGLPVVYVDSGSHDGSVALAKSLGVEVHELDPSRPFSAGRARNEGVDKLLTKRPDLKYVMFLDGDCVLHESFPEVACATLETDSDCAIVTGHLSERHPEASVYNRLCSIEWRSPTGRIDHMNGLGGIMMARVSSFRAVGGFDPQAIAGEEPDLGARLILGGFYILKIDTPMATHDAEILTFQQWWRRAVRAGHALADRYTRHGQSELRDGRREFFSALFWGVALPVVILLLLWPSCGLSLFLLGGYVAFGWRVYRHYRSNGLSSPDARLVTRFIIYAKVAQAVGIYKFYRAKRQGSFRIIEYK